MPHDEWRASLRMNHANAAALAATLVELPADGFQRAGTAILADLADPDLRLVAVELVAALTERAWDGDRELAYTIQQHLGGRPLDLAPIPVDLDELGEAFAQSLESSRSSTSTPAGPAHSSTPARNRRLRPRRPWTLAPLRRVRPQPGYRDMERFTGTLDDPATSAALEAALDGRGAFRTLSCCA